jgi:transcriptional regulator EpsA
MNGLLDFSTEETELFMLTVECSVRITRRFQFFLWAQGTLQRFVPHEALIYAQGDTQGQKCAYEVLTRAVLDNAAETQLCGPNFGLGAGLLRHWLDTQEGVILTQAGDGEIGQRIERLGYVSAACVGLTSGSGHSDTFFAFLAREPLSSRHAQFAQLLLPNLHYALVRTRRAEKQPGPTPETQPDELLSFREFEVLSWMREGKTNHEIGHLLDISPLTVKNHVSNILRKLNVTNRAQAVAMGMKTGLFSHGAAHGNGDSHDRRTHPPANDRPVDDND